MPPLHRGGRGRGQLGDRTPASRGSAKRPPSRAARARERKRPVKREWGGGGRLAGRELSWHDGGGYPMARRGPRSAKPGRPGRGNVRTHETQYHGTRHAFLETLDAASTHRTGPTRAMRHLRPAAQQPRRSPPRSGWRRGPPGVADVLRVIARHEPVAAREISRPSPAGPDRRRCLREAAQARDWPGTVSCPVATPEGRASPTRQAEQGAGRPAPPAGARAAAAWAWWSLTQSRSWPGCWNARSSASPRRKWTWTRPTAPRTPSCAGCWPCARGGRAGLVVVAAR